MLCFFILNAVYPMPAVDTRFARVVVDKTGAPMRAFADKKGVWRYPVQWDEIAPNYIEALLTYEDRWFYSHPGVNPLAILRALGQWLIQGEIVSGASTLTMQVARLIDPVPRSLSGKTKQIFRALQLEYLYSKDEILTLYLNRAPFGGVVEGVQAAAFTYFGKSAEQLSDAEAALLAVLPQAPSRYRPDRYPTSAQTMRDKVLQRMGQRGVWSQVRVDDAIKEPVWAQVHKQPLRAPLLSRRLVNQHPRAAVQHTTLDANLQQGIADVIKNKIYAMPSGTSAAVLVMENHSLAVRAYVGSADFFDGSRFGHVDMVQALRSPGSTLKPFIYGLALDAGLIHSQSLLIDAPSNFGDYRPQNFDHGYRGPVSVGQALQRSLNVPAIQVLEKVGGNQLMSQLKSVGMTLKLPAGGKANLALGLGGVGTTLESLVGAYSSLANAGYAGKPRLLQSDALWQRRLLSEGSAWVVRQLLNSHQRPDQPVPYLINYDAKKIAWKTGTSYGFRDSWAVGVTADYTVGVWIGRPDATPIPGYYGAVAAVPILFAITDNLPPLSHALDQADQFPVRYQAQMPASVTQETICWPLGGLAEETPVSQCHMKKQAYLVDGNVPATFANNSDNWGVNPAAFLVAADTGLRVDINCHQQRTQQRYVALWPNAVEAWIEPKLRRQQQIPAFDERCEKPPAIAAGEVKIAGIHSGSVLRSVGVTDAPPRIQLHALGGQGKHQWFINGKLHYSLNAAAKQAHEFSQPGKYTIAVVDEQGSNDEVVVWVSD